MHDLGDSISIGLSYFLERKSKKKADNRYTYGYIRYSVLGGVITTTILLVGSILVIINAENGPHVLLIEMIFLLPRSPNRRGITNAIFCMGTQGLLAHSCKLVIHINMYRQICSMHSHNINIFNSIINDYFRIKG